MASLKKWIRLLHRDIGFLLVGLTVVFCVSGIVLIYRDTDIFRLKNEYTVQLDRNLGQPELRDQLNFKRLHVEEETDSKIVFDKGSYDKLTGIAKYTLMEYPAFIRKMNNMHTAISREKLHFFATIFGVLLLFQALSSFWMFNFSSKVFKRALVLSAIGIALAVALVCFWG